MIFEEALVELRKGKKIRHPHFDKDEYLTGCYFGLPDFYDDNGKLVTESFEEKKARGMSIVKMKGDRQADEMAGKSNYIAKIKRQLKKILTEEEYKKYHNFYTEMAIAEIFDDAIFHFPHLNLFLVMSDEWEIIE
jgi:hypothetical protein